MNLVRLFGKTYAWVQATRTGQWRLVRVPDNAAAACAPGADPDFDVLADLRIALIKAATSWREL